MRVTKWKGDPLVGGLGMGLMRGWGLLEWELQTARNTVHDELGPRSGVRQVLVKNNVVIFRFLEKPTTGCGIRITNIGM